MKMTLGPFEVPVDLAERLNKKLLDLTIRDLQAAGGEPPIDIVHTGRSPIIQPRVSIEEDAATEDLALLKASGFTDQTILKISRRLLGKSFHKELMSQKMAEIHEAVISWSKRDLSKENIWAVYIESFENTRTDETFYVVLGLNDKNQLTMLEVSTTEPSLSSRKLNTKKVKFVMVDPSDKKSQKQFPNAAVQFDWFKYLHTAPPEKKAQLEDVMYNADVGSAKRGLTKLKAPIELLTFHKFDRELWRALRMASGVQRVERDLRSKLKLKLLRTPEQKEFIKAFTLWRLQYHWNNIPVDSETLTNLKHIKARLEER